jgi:hypothetical protein
VKVEDELARIELVLVEALNAVHAVRQRIDKPDIGPAQPALPQDLIEVGVAAKLAHRSCHAVRNWCRLHVIGSPGGFAVKVGGRWMVSRRSFLEFCRR